MKRALNIILAIVMWAAVIAFAVLASIYAREQRAKVKIREVRIRVIDSRDNKLVDAATIARWLSDEGLSPLGQSIDSVGARKIEAALGLHDEVLRANVFSNLDGVMRIRIEQRVPVMRVEVAKGYKFWYTDDGYILSDRENFSPEALLVTGSVPFPFSPSVTGNYADIERANYNDFLQQFVAIDTERKSLEARRSALRANLRNERAKNPKRVWGAARKERFLEDKATRIAEIEKQLDDTSLALKNLAEKKQSTLQKEKKSHQIHRLLPKLANFVEFIRNDDFFRARVSKIEAAEKGAGVELRLIPSEEGYTILLGELDGGEFERMEKLRTFLLAGRQTGFDRIDARYDKQIIATSSEKEKEDATING